MLNSDDYEITKLYGRGLTLVICEQEFELNDDTDRTASKVACGFADHASYIVNRGSGRSIPK